MEHVVATERLTQLTGSTRADTWPLTQDAAHLPFRTDTRAWGVTGVDLGANAEHDGRLYVFFGDVATEQDPAMPGFSGIPVNADLVCWSDASVVDPFRAHVAVGWDFVLPNDQQGASPETGQPGWRFCERCVGLFNAPDGDPTDSACPAGGAHQPVGWTFVLPNVQQGATAETGQPDWRLCGRCHGLFWAEHGDTVDSACPLGGRHDPVGWTFVLPNDHQGATAETGQPHWRFCGRCHGLFYDGYPDKGVCPGAVGGGFRLQAVLGEHGHFDPFLVDGEIGLLLSNETPTGAFSHDGHVYVFVWVGARPGQDVPAGSYLVRKQDPAVPGPFQLVASVSPLDFGGAGFWQVAPTVVSNVEHPGLPTDSGEGVVLLGHGFNAARQQDGVHVGWVPLTPAGPDLAGTRYLTHPAPTWSPHQTEAMAVFDRPGYTSLSTTWLPGPARWLVLYSRAHPTERARDCLVARVGPLPWQWSDELVLLDPGEAGAYTVWMHQPGADRINPDVPPAQAPGHDDSGWLYGAHLLTRFTEWDEPTRRLTIHYLLSTGSPYQVHLMRSVLQL